MLIYEIEYLENGQKGHSFGLDLTNEMKRYDCCLEKQS